MSDRERRKGKREREIEGGRERGREGEREGERGREGGEEREGRREGGGGEVCLSWTRCCLSPLIRGQALALLGRTAMSVLSYITEV